MDQTATANSPKTKDAALGWFIGGLLLLLCLSFVFGWFDNTTELTPSHDSVLNSCFAIAGLGGLISGGVVFFLLKGAGVLRRVWIASLLVLVGSLSVFLFSIRIADIVEGLIDFPSGKTQSYPSLLVVSRAYQTHGKGSSSNIQTTPIWSNLEVTAEDYRFMQTHRRPGDAGRNPDEISSEGYFCARVTLQQSGSAVRVMHAGNQALPRGTVIICPPDASGP